MSPLICVQFDTELIHHIQGNSLTEDIFTSWCCRRPPCAQTSNQLTSQGESAVSKAKTKIILRSVANKIVVVSNVTLTVERVG